MSNSTTSTAAEHLQTVIRHWPDLQDMLDTPTVVNWPPSGLRSYLRDLEAVDRAELAAERADTDPSALGESAAPLRIHVLDTMRTVEGALLRLADITASRIQRPALTVGLTGRGWVDEAQLAAVALARRDREDPRRWSYQTQRDATTAANWLMARLTGQPGPFRSLTDDHLRHISRVAEAAAERVERTLGTTRQARTLPDPCPHCRGALEILGGDGTPPAVKCTACGRSWTADTAA